MKNCVGISSPCTRAIARHCLYAKTITGRYESPVLDSAVFQSHTVDPGFCFSFNSPIVELVLIAPRRLTMYADKVAEKALDMDMALLSMRDDWQWHLCSILSWLPSSKMCRLRYVENTVWLNCTCYVRWLQLLLAVSRNWFPAGYVDLSFRKEGAHACLLIKKLCIFSEVLYGNCWRLVILSATQLEYLCRTESVGNCRPFLEANHILHY